jgi:hypothetical protein
MLILFSLPSSAYSLDCSIYRAQCPDDHDKCVSEVSGSHDACVNRCNGRDNGRDKCLHRCEYISSEHTDLCDSSYDNCLNGQNPMEDLCIEALQNQERLRCFGCQ